MCARSVKHRDTTECARNVCGSAKTEITEVNGSPERGLFGRVLKKETGKRGS